MARAAGGLVLILCFWAFVSQAQVTTATISGVVKDESNAVLPGATVMATNVETGIARSVAAGSRGEYRIQALGLGSYTVTATMTGFQSTTRSGVTLTLGLEAVMDFTLAVGSVAEQVTVTGEAPLIETTTATVSGLVNPQQMRDIPLNARSFIDLVPLQAGAVFAETGGASTVQGFGVKVSIGGTRYNGNAFLLDGANISDTGGVAGSAAGTLAGMESVREFKVITNAYDAEYGNHVGGVVSAVTKSGTNEFHGSLFEFLRNDKLDAPSFDDNRLNGGEKPPYRRNQFGGTAGGPVKKNSLFFFGSFEALREALGSLGNYPMPGPLVRQGCIPRTTGTGVNQVRTQVDCFNANGSFTTFRPDASGVWPVIPSTAGYIVPSVAPFMTAYPQGNQPSTATAQYADGANPNGTINLALPNTQTTHQNYWLARVDKTLRDRDNFFFRYNNDVATQITPLYDVASFNTTADRYATLEETHIFSPSLLALTDFSFIRTAIGIKNLTKFQLGTAAYKLPLYSFRYNDNPGRLSVGALQAWGMGSSEATGIPKRNTQNSFQFKEGLHYTAGRQAIKMGGDFNRVQFNQMSTMNDSGVYTFSTLDNFIAGNVDSFIVTTPSAINRRGWRQSILGLYVQDDIRVRDGLTIDVGLRYEISSVLHEVNNRIGTLRDTTPAHVSVVTPNTVNIGNPYYENPSLRNFAPRIGVAWTPFKNRKTSIRAGAGEFFDQITGKEIITAGAFGVPIYTMAALNANSFFLSSGQKIAFPDAYITQANLLLAGGGVPNDEGIDYKLSQPTVYKYSFSIQQQLLPETMLEVGYSGSRSLHNWRLIQINTTPVAYIPALGGQYIFPEQPLLNPNFGSMRWRFTDGSGKYNALLVTLNKRFSHGFQAQSSYTFSKSTDDGSRFAAAGDFSNDRDPIGHGHDWGRSAFDLTHSWVTNFVYDLPGGTLHGLTGKVLGGWSISGILRATSGNPLSLNATLPTANRLPSGALAVSCGTTAGCISSSVQSVTGATVNLVGQIKIKPGNRDQYFDPSIVALPASFLNTPALVNYPGAGRNGAAGALIAVGNIGRNVLTGPGLFNVDLTLRKETPVHMLGEAGKMEFRFEMFNAMNHTRLSNPGTTIFDNLGRLAGTAGVITGYRGNPRQLQLALRLAF